MSRAKARATAPDYAGYLLVILGVSVVFRVGIAIYMGERVESLPGINDQLSYNMLAGRVLGGYGFTVPSLWWPMTRPGQPTAHWSYLYTLYMAAVYAIAGVHPLVVRLIQAILVGVLWPLLTYRIARRVAGARVALVAAGWTAVYGYFAYYGAALMTEPFYITAILWSLDLALGLVPFRGGFSVTVTNHSRAGLAIGRTVAAQGSAGATYGRWLLLGVTLGVAVLLRQLFALFVPFLLLWVWLAARRNWQPFSARRYATGVALTLGVVLLMVLPWTARNYLAFHQLVLLNTNAGYAFFWANHPIYGTHFMAILPRNISYASLIPTELRSLDEAALDKALLSRGMGFVWADPFRYLLLSFSRFGTYFMFWPSSDSSGLSNVVRVLSFGLALPFMLYGIVLAAMRTWGRPAGRTAAASLGAILAEPTTLLLGFIVVYSAIHLLSWALIRYRLPVDAVGIIFAAWALYDLASRVLARFARQAAAPAPGVDY